MTGSESDLRASLDREKKGGGGGLLCGLDGHKHTGINQFTLQDDRTLLFNRNKWAFLQMT